jgi:signal transduction histidine kinase
MKIGPRIALALSVLVALSLGAQGILSHRARRAELESDLERQAVDLARALAAAVEAEAELGRLGVGDPLALAQQLARRSFGATLHVLRLDDYVAEDAEPDAKERARRVQIQGEAVRELTRRDGRAFLALAFPVRREGQVVGVLELRRDASFIDRSLRQAELRIVGTALALIALLTAAALLIARATISAPLGRMLQEIGEVAKGDLTRTVFADREDEVGQLASRFNEMTSSLRESREETRRGAEARLALEDRLRQSEKLATIGQLAAEIAHEVGTPLAVIGGRARAMEKKALDPEGVTRNAGIIAAQATRISKIIERLLHFARRRSPATRASVDLGRVVAEAVEFLEHQIERSGVRVSLRASADVASLPGDPDAIQQVCLNLIVNAIQAMPKGGQLRIATRSVIRRKGELASAPPLPYACLEVTDSGVGISEEKRAQIFEPFYSTKEEGSGLGLAVSHGIVKDHDGWIEVECPPQGGTTFRVFLPTAAEAASTQPGRAHG